jgi:hypothetical protein
VNEIFPDSFLFEITQIFTFCFIRIFIATRFAKFLVVTIIVFLSIAFMLHFSFPSDKCDVCFEL